MQIDLPYDLFNRIQQHAIASGGGEADVVRRALDSLESDDRERAAIQEGIDAWRRGDVRPFDEFDKEFCAEHGIRVAE